jgi:hypothetical protein
LDFLFGLVWFGLIGVGMVWLEARWLEKYIEHMEARILVLFGLVKWFDRGWHGLVGGQVT